jgi:hypothetical protein
VSGAFTRGDLRQVAPARAEAASVRQSAWRRAPARRASALTLSRATPCGSDARVCGSMASGSASATGVPP